MLPCLVTTDMNLAVAFFVWSHDTIWTLPPAPPAIGPTISYDLPTTQQWIGYGLSGSYTTTIQHLSQNIMLEGHNVGIDIPHLTVPFSALMAVHTLLSERRMNFSSSLVHMDNKPVACAGTVPGYLPMSDCGNPTENPTTVFPINNFNTVAVGITDVDILAGWAKIIVYLIVDLYFFHLAGPAAPVVEKFSNMLLKIARSKVLPFTEGKTAIKFALKTIGRNLPAAIKHDAAGKEGGATLKIKLFDHLSVYQADLELGLFGTAYKTRAPLPSSSTQKPCGNAPQIEGNPSPAPLTADDTTSQGEAS